ncbi:ankyrin repeat-containing domain protein [Penicillium sp. IBT 16267x]|nr:ankyrin repeat-containing domain protein [Penicillium sp. IBT 16267x]
MDVNPDNLIDYVKRRRLQNRVAQRKFREKKRREALNALPKDPHQQSSGSSKILPSISSDNSDRPQGVSVASSRTPLTNVPNAAPTELPMTVFEQELVNTNIDLNSVDHLLRESNNEPFLLPNTPSFQSEFVAPNLDPETFMRTFTPQQFDASFISIPGGDSDCWRSDSRQGTPFLPSRLPDNDTSHALPLSHSEGSIPGLIVSNNDVGWLSSFHIATQGGHEQIVQALLRNNTTDINKADSDGRTALIHAVVENHQPVVRLLLGGGALIGASDCDGRSALHWAVLFRRIEILEVLLKHREEYEARFNIDTHDSTGWTPLHMAINRAFEPGVLMLIQSGADINVKANKCPHTGNIMPLLNNSKLEGH